MSTSLERREAIGDYVRARSRVVFPNPVRFESVHCVCLFVCLFVSAMRARAMCTDIS